MMPRMDPSHKEIFSTFQTGEEENIKEEINWTRRSDILLEKARENIRNNPMNYVKNIIANTLRFFFGYPYSYQLQSLTMYFYLVMNSLILIPLLLSFYPAWINRQEIPIEILFVLLMGLIYIGGSVLVSAVPRYFHPAIPFLLLWSIYILNKYVNFKMTIKTPNAINSGSLQE